MKGLLRQITAILMSITFAGLANAGDNCGSVRLDGHGGSMESIPVFDQNQLGECYSIVGAELYDAHRIAHGADPKRLTSPIHAAIMSSQKSKGGDGEIEGGYTKRVLQYLRAEGGCEADFFNRTFSKKIPEDFIEQLLQYQAKLLRFENLEPSQDSTGTVSVRIRHWIRNKSLRKLEEISHGQASQHLVTAAASCINTAPALEQDPIPKEVLYRIMKMNDPSTFLISSLKMSCPASEKTAGGSSLRTDEFLVGQDIALKDVKENLDALLTSNQSMPVAIGVCSGVLRRGPNFKGMIHDSDDNPEEIKNCGIHEVVLIGRRKNPQTGNCQYLVRNSWGKDCSKYDKKWECQDGSLWVDSDSLIQNMDSIQTISR